MRKGSSKVPMKFVRHLGCRWCLLYGHRGPRPRAGSPPTTSTTSQARPRVMILSDIGNEPDDQMSFVRLLLYSNEFDLEALIASTSTWQRKATHPETMRQIIDTYGQVSPNLLFMRRAGQKLPNSTAASSPASLPTDSPLPGRQNIRRSSRHHQRRRPRRSASSMDLDLGRSQHPRPGAA